MELCAVILRCNIKICESDFIYAPDFPGLENMTSVPLYQGAQYSKQDAACIEEPENDLLHGWWCKVYFVCVCDLQNAPCYLPTFAVGETKSPLILTVIASECVCEIKLGRVP